MDLLPCGYGESGSEALEQTHWKCQRTVASDTVSSVHPKVMVCQTPSEPRESTYVTEMYHHEWGKISLEREKNLLAALPKPKYDYSLGNAPRWEEYEEETLEPECESVLPMEMRSSFTAPQKIGPDEEIPMYLPLFHICSG